MRIVEIILGLLVMSGAFKLGYDEFVRPLFVGLTIRERIWMIIQGVLGAFAMWAFCVVMIVMAPEGM